MNVRAYVLVGKSRRLPGKHFIEIFPGKRLIDIVVDNLLSLGLEVIIYSRIPFDANVPVLMDRSEWILESVISLVEREPFFLFGGDMPTVKKEAVELMLEAHKSKFSVVPRWSDTGYLEPLHAIYTPETKECLKGAKSLTYGLKNCPYVRFVPAELMPKETFFNVNTSEDLSRLITTLR
jgi:molybdopterin-guanine dinucleotide biosynthesis protein A